MAFNNQLVWITGASSGIGKATAIAFSRTGATVILSSRRESELEAVRQECKNPEKHHIVPLDLLDEKGIFEQAQYVLDKIGTPDILVNNGGISQRSLIVDTEMSVVRKIMETNFFGTVALTKAVLPAMLERKSGNIVLISSLTGKFGTRLRSIYAASKHAVMGFADALRAETHTHGIKVNVILPGFIRTNMSQNALKGDGNPHAVMDKTTDKGMAPEECAQGILNAVTVGKAEVLISGKEQIMVYLKRFFPRIFNWLILKIKVT